MLCRDVERNEIADKYLNGQLDPALQDEFELHILDCRRCLASVELLEAVREDLAARAPEIRSHALVSGVRFRWRWVAVAAFSLLALTFGVLSTRKLFSGRDAKSARVQGAATTKPETAEAQHDQGSRIRGVAPPKETASSRSAGSSKRSGSPSDVGSQTAPLQVASQATSEHDIAKADTHQAGASDKLDNPAPGPQPPSSAPPPVLQSSEQPHEHPKLLSDEGEKELFRLALVNPPPYTFSGFTRYAKDTPSGSKSSGVRPGEIKAPDGKRPAFQNAMLAYVDGNYERAGELLELALKQEPPAPDTYFFLGVCRLLQSDAAGSIAPLKSALMQAPSPFTQRLIPGPSPFTQSAHYYLAKAYLKTHDLAAAENQMQAAASLAGDWTESARVELARLRALRAREGQ
jgi:hypothetical protein